MKPEWALADLSPAGTISLFESGAFGTAGRSAAKLDSGSASARWGTDARVGIVFNRRAHANLSRDFPSPGGNAHLDWASPRTQAELSATMRRFAERGIDVLIVDGGDGTIRDVLTAAVAHFGDALPTLAIVPSGKTNALAIDLGLSKDWSLRDALQVIGTGRVEQRTPIEIDRVGSSEPHLRGFLFGAGAFVRATELAQRAHRLGAFHGVAVGLSLAGAIAQTIFGGRENPWRRGDAMRIELPDGRLFDQAFYLLLGTTLERLPLGLKPFGRPRPGFKLLGIDAPPRRVLSSLPALLTGSEAEWLDERGYHRGDADSFKIALDSGFILDGETYAGGDFLIRRGPTLNFLVP